MSRVLVTRRPPGDALDRLGAEFDVDAWTEDLPMPHDELLDRIGEVEGLFCMLTDRIDEHTLADHS